MRSRAEGASEKEFALFILRVVRKLRRMLFAAASRGRGALAQVGRDVEAQTAFGLNQSILKLGGFLFTTPLASPVSPLRSQNMRHSEPQCVSLL